MKNVISKYIKGMLQCVILVSMLQLTAQEPSGNIPQNWNAGSSTMITNGAEVATSSNLIKQDPVFKWIQTSNDGNAETYEFLVGNVSGEWNTSTHTGELDYTIFFDGERATLKLRGTSDGIKMILAMYDQGTIVTSVAFQIDTLTYL